MKTDPWFLLLLCVMLAVPDMSARLRRVMAIGYGLIFLAVLAGWLK